MKNILPTFLVSLLLTAPVSGQTPFTVILTKTEREVIPEGIAINPADGKIYVSSIALKKIIAIDSTGAHEDFVKTSQNGLLEALGMKIDAQQQWLWVVSNHKQGKGGSLIHAFDIHTKAMKQQYEIRDTLQHLLNDLIIHPNGRVYITDTYAASIYEVDPHGQHLSLFMQDPRLSGANGIAYNARGMVYVSTQYGLMQLDLPSKKLSPLTYADANKKAFWMDGILSWNNSILGVADAGIMHYQLNAAGTQIKSEQVIDQQNKFFHEPTTAALYRNKLYVLANSYLASYNENRESVKGIEDKLGPVVIVVYKLADIP